MTAIQKTAAASTPPARPLTSRQGTVLTARYQNQKQADIAASVIAKRREALLYLSKR